MFTVAVNNRVLSSPVTTDYKRRHELITFYLDGNDTPTFVNFCAIGTSDGKGAIIDNIVLKFHDCNY